MSKESRRRQNRDRTAEAQYRFRGQVVEAIGSALGTAAKYGSLALCVYFMADAFKAFAGKATVADLAVGAIGRITIERGVSFVVTLSAVVYGWKERSLRRRKTAYLQGRIQELELTVDPKRSSSRLTDRGETRPEDKEI